MQSSGNPIPYSANVVSEWLDGLFDGTPVRQLWPLFSPSLRTIYAQQWLYLQGRDRNDGVVKALSLEDANGTLAQQMFSDYSAHWKSVYSDLSSGHAFWDKADLVGPDMEIVVAFARIHQGFYSAGKSLPAHSFIVIFDEGIWRIAALARRIPVPGWPPTEQIIPGLLGDGPSVHE
ncbi:hypothetical protein [Actinokineospora globicatena]|uniref:hypothetical protein n=1 Tax=Actinokineospora globicatena TaxID=103729 RepID=UPI0020A38A35|nr:hypothetical protein [Actinokineospora globicatena]MCP2306100.1 hypothetical protein [Actinokineospora globicatena]GLW80026.1 hypothetical protein Aglo01_45070 [Actinokineospora globicatena]GLW86855.1 hypothetical protein Aglo02_44940 [Actinokineospora globicatena]